jgi:curved DNA-binding protein CbpA
VDLYEELGVGRDATPAEIKAAHRRQAKDHHPDRGGDRSKFQAVQLAYDTLKDEDRRRRYDDTGQTAGAERPDPATIHLAVLIDSLIDQLLGDGMPIETVDMRTIAIEACDEKLRAIRSEKGGAERALSKARKLASRFKRKRKAKGPDLISSALERKQRDIQAAIAKYDDAIMIWQRGRELLESYTYKVDPAPAERPRDMRFFQTPPGGFDFNWTPAR